MLRSLQALQLRKSLLSAGRNGVFVFYLQARQLEDSVDGYKDMIILRGAN